MMYSLFYRDMRDEKTQVFTEVEEVRIAFNEKDTTLPQFLDAHKNQEIVIEIDNLSLPENFNYVLFLNLWQKHSNIRYSIAYFLNDPVRQYFEKNSIPHFYKDILVYSWDQLHSLLFLPTTDIYIGGILGFDIIKVAEMCRKAGKRIRVIPNLAQSASFTGEENITSFFIRPEDVELYAPFVDVMEIDAPVTYKAYKNQKWFGQLFEIIKGLSSNVDNRSLSGLFGIVRLSCQKRCVKGKNCQVCWEAEKMANTLSQNGYIIRKEKKNGN